MADAVAVVPSKSIKTLLIPELMILITPLVPDEPEEPLVPDDPDEPDVPLEPDENGRPEGSEIR